MFDSMSIHNFRCFDDFSIGSLGRVNLIAGANNVGKTALLEAIFLLLGVTNASLVATISVFRGIGEFKGDLTSVRGLLWSPLFPKFDSQAKIQISGSLSMGGQCNLELQLVPGTSARLALGEELAAEIGPGANGLPGLVMQLRYTDPSGETRSAEMWMDKKGVHIEPAPSQPPCPGFFLPARHRPSLQEDAERFGQLEVMEEPYDLLETLKITEPRLKRLATIFSAGMPIIYGDIGLGRMLPLPLMGDGLGRLASLLLVIASAPHGVVLVDEIENGLHHSVLTKVWQAVGDAARRFDTQVFATTHSFEAIQAAQQAFGSGESHDFRLHRLENVAGKIKAFTYDQETLAAAMKVDMEVR